MQRRTSGEEVDIKADLKVEDTITTIIVVTVEVVNMVAATTAEEAENGRGSWYLESREQDGAHS